MACAAVAGEFDRKPLNRKERKGVTVNGTAIDPMKYPFMARYMPGESVEINNSGTEVYIIESRKVRTYKPVSDSMSFRVSRSMPSLTVREGEEFEMKVSVLNVQAQGGVVIEIPVPAGCGYVAKIQNEFAWESSREYRKDRILIYCEYLPFGRYDFKVKLRARFSGKFKLPPARAALQFYPEKAGYTLGEVLEIK